MLQTDIRRVFIQLINSLEQIDASQYTHACNALSGASIGKHLRHVIELFQCLEHGYQTGIVNYDNRLRDIRMENDKDFAITCLRKIEDGFASSDKHLVLESISGEPESGPMLIDTNYHRELLYNLEHTIHHMALIRVGLQELTQLNLPDEFGVASSTIKFRKACAQ